MKKLKLSKSSWYGLCLFMMALLLAMTPFVATAATFTVDAQDEFFDPDPVSISVGDTVHWVRTGAEIHTVDSGGYNTGPCSEPNFGGVILLNHLDTYDHTFTTPGPCGYKCSIHPGMDGTINVAGGTTTTIVATTTTTRPTTTTTTTVATTTTTTTVATTTTTRATTTTTTTVATITTTVATTTTTRPATTTTTVATTTTTTVATTTTTIVATTTTTVATTTTTRPATTTTTVATTTTTVATTTTTRPATTTTTVVGTTTTTVPSTLGDVAIKDIAGPKKADTCKTKKYEVRVKNNSNTTQTRNVQLFVDGVPAGPGQLITLDPGKEGKVKFDVTFSSAGTATLMASLFPPDSNTSNDTLSETVKVKDCKDKDKGKDKDKDK